MKIDDFTPAAIDKNQDARVEIGVKNDVLIEAPHIEVRNWSQPRFKKS